MSVTQLPAQMYMPKVSVIIPTYNREKYIVETLQSVFAQTFTDYEVIVIDDGSTDNTSVVLKPYLDRIIYIRKPNGGQGSARNAGIKMAKGEYMAFLDSDDLWMPEKLELQVKYLDEHPDVGLVFTDYVVFSEDSPSHGLSPARGEGGQRRFSDELNKKCYSGNDLSFNILFRGNFIANLTVMVRMDCFECVGYFDESRELIGGEDYDMWLRIAIRYKLGHIPEILAQYRVHGDNVIGTDLEKGYILQNKVINKILINYPEAIEEFNIDMREYYRDYYYCFGRALYQSKKYIPAIENLRKAIAYKPVTIKPWILLFLSILLCYTRISRTERVG